MVIDKDSELPKFNFIQSMGMILFFGFALGFIVFLISLASQNLTSEDPTNETNITQPTFAEVYTYCNYNLDNYTYSNPDYLVCESQDECDLKSLRLNVIRGEAFNCMNAFWGERE